MAASAPASFARPSLASLGRVPKARGPAILASCTAARPTPPAAEWTSTLLPGPVESTVCRRWYAVSTWIRSAAPSTKLTESGSGMTMKERHTQIPRVRAARKGGDAHTRIHVRPAFAAPLDDTRRFHSGDVGQLGLHR